MAQNGQRHLVFVSKPSGYELAERDGAAPERGTEVELEERRYVVAKVAASPLPQDERPCAFLEGVS